MVAVLSILGDHAPLIALFEVVGKADIVPPEQIAGTAVNVGIELEVLTVIVKVVVFAH